MTVMARTTRRSIVWWVVALLFALLNVGGAVFAAMAAEVTHFALHLVLAFATAPFVWWLAPMRRRRDYED